MSIILLVVAFIVGLILCVLSVHLRDRSRTSEMSGFFSFYRDRIDGVMVGEFRGENLLCALHLGALHAIVPLFGLGLFLRTDGNFLAVVVAILYSMQLAQRVYPASLVADGEDGE